MSFAASSIKNTTREIDSPSETGSKRNRYKKELIAEGSSWSHKQKLTSYFLYIFHCFLFWTVRLPDLGACWYTIPTLEADWKLSFKKKLTHGNTHQLLLMNPINPGSFIYRNKQLSNITDMIYTWNIWARAQDKMKSSAFSNFCFGINMKKCVPIIYFVKHVIK